MLDKTIKLIINNELCKGCEICAEFCPQQVLELSGGKAVIKHPENCISCGLCEKLCPDYAVEVISIPAAVRSNHDAGIEKAERIAQNTHVFHEMLSAGADIVRHSVDLTGDKSQVAVNNRQETTQCCSILLKSEKRDYSQSVLLQGSEACLEGALAAGMNFYAGYPITPSTEISESAALKLPLAGGCFLQMEDEIAGIAAVIGASAAGAKAMTATSGPGFSLQQESVGYAALAEIPCVIVNVQRKGPSTGIPTAAAQGDVMQTRWGTHGDHPVIVLSPSSVAETYTLIIRSFNLAEKYRVPVIFLMDAAVAHMRESVKLQEPSRLEIINRELPDPNDSSWLPYKVDSDADVPKIPPFGWGCRYHITGLLHDARGIAVNSGRKAEIFSRRLSGKIKLNSNDIITFEEMLLNDAEIVIVCFGITARSVQTAVRRARKIGIKVGMFRLITIWPFPGQRIKELAEQTERIVVAEMNEGQIVLEVERFCAGCCRVTHFGKVDGNLFTPTEIINALKSDNNGDGYGSGIDQ